MVGNNANSELTATAGGTDAWGNSLGTDPWSDKTWGKLGGVDFEDTNAAEDIFPLSADPPVPDFGQTQPQQPQQQPAPQPSGFNHPGVGVGGATTTDSFLFPDDGNNAFWGGGVSGFGKSSQTPPSEPQEEADKQAEEEKPESFFQEEHKSEDHAPSHSFSSGPATVRVAIHEQVSALYDGVTEDPVCHVEGSIYVQPTADLEETPFLLVLRDREGHVANWKDWPSTCQNVSDQVSRKGLHRTDRVLRITTRSREQRPHSKSVAEDTLIAQYICSSRVQPVPLLIKSRVVNSHRHCRVGFKVRANPSNGLALTRVVLLLAVPPHVEGRTAKMSRKGGVWDELKRTISWVIPKMEPGQALEIQAQFEGTEPADENQKFPILAQGDYEEAYSLLEVKKSDAIRDDVSHPIKSLQINRSGRVLHRKV